MTQDRKVVVVDDDMKVILLVEKVLTQKGFQVFSATEGKKALELVEEEKPGVLITDILQPGLDGVSLYHKIKRDPQLSHTKIIMISGIYNEASFKLQMDCHPDGYVEKPIEIDKLADLVAEKIKDCPGHTGSPGNAWGRPVDQGWGK